MEVQAQCATVVYGILTVAESRERERAQWQRVERERASYLMSFYKGANPIHEDSTLIAAAAAAAKSLQSCLTLCDPIDGSPPGSPVPGILQARTLEWVAISFSNA